MSADDLQNRISTALQGAVPEGIERTIELKPSEVLVNVPVQRGVPMELDFGWEGLGDHIFWMVGDELKWEAFSFEAPDQAAIEDFAQFVLGLLSGELLFEVTRVRSTGKLWRTRLFDPRKPAGEQLIYRYYRHAFRWFQRSDTSFLRFGADA